MLMRLLGDQAGGPLPVQVRTNLYTVVLNSSLH
jgi:hypothetical protein